MNNSERQGWIFLPVSINITDKKILLVGGGKVAAEKLSLLSRFTENITILAPEINDYIKNSHFKIIRKEYHKSDLEGFFIVYACTNNQTTNQKIKEEANLKGLLVNVVDNPELCDFISPAIYKNDNMTVSVSSNAQDVKKSIVLRDRIKTFLEHGEPSIH